VNIVISTFGSLQRLSQLENSKYPQFLCGRILPVINVLQAPISGKPCVYYEAWIEECVEKTDENGLIGIPDEHDINNVWIPLYREVKTADFTLIDPDFPNIALYIPGTIAPIKVLATEEQHPGQSPLPNLAIQLQNAPINSQHHHHHHHSQHSVLKTKYTVQSLQLPKFTQEFIGRGKVDMMDRKGSANKRNFRYREANFEYGEQLAVLGIVEDTVDEDGQPTKLLKPVGHEVLTPEYCEQKGWSTWDRQSWLDLTQEPSIILTDMKKYFQGMIIPPLPARPSYAQIVRVLHDSVRIVGESKVENGKSNNSGLEIQHMQR